MITNLILVLLQVSFFGELVAPIFVPNLVFGFAFAIMFIDLSETSYMSAFFGGILLDLLTFGIIGVSSLTFVGFLFLFSFVRRYISKSVYSSSLGVVVTQFLYVWFVLGFETVGFGKILTNSFITLAVALLFQVVLGNFIDYLGRSGYKISE